MHDATEVRTVTKTLQGLAQPDPASVATIPGYELEERIGAGGYGEVWRARAPGGLMKAVKIVYGSIDDARAATESKALERIKTVRHPFILTLERIEIVEGRLIVVTELADKSLRDRFEECNQRIPRDELLKYMSDTAEALDYMFDKHSLQHLDIKPENLLLLGDHVKVADFGLAKNLGDGSMSVVSGITPHYVPPEVLEGRPSQHSDQYSLAVVYQALLTGMPTFRGRTAAQLISQHLHSPPNLSDLPASDQSAVARALSKNPARRFESCSEFIRNLTNATQQQPAVASRAPSVKMRPVGKGGRIHVRQLDPSEAVLTPLPPVSLAGVEQRARPTFVLGIGGLAKRVLQSLRRRLAGDLDDEQPLPVGLLYVDTDEGAVSDAVHGSETDSALTRSETLAIPLRPASAYRSRFKELGEWMPRRWLFNMPRSHLTEGIRPLGRLAFVDHYRAICSRLTEALSELVEDASIEHLRTFTSLEPDRDNPRVFVVGSLGGGTGSGAILDAGYAVRHVLRELKLSDARTYGVLLQPNVDPDSQNLLGAANATACLNELHHYSGSEFYPGDGKAGIPTMEYTRPFSETYLVPLAGESAARPEDGIAEYLYHSIAGSTAPVFDHLRAGEQAAEKALCVRSFSAVLHDRADTSAESPAESGRGREPQLENELDSDTQVGVDLQAVSEAEFEAALDAKAARESRSTPAPAVEPRPPRTAATLEATVAESRRRLAITRGSVSLLIATKNELGGDRLDAITAAHGEKPTMLTADDPAFVCHEVTGIPIADFAALLHADRPNIDAIAERLQTRVDVDW